MRKYDFGLIWCSSPEEKFIGWLKRECSWKDFSFILINNDNAQEIIQRLSQQQIKISFLFDDEADYSNPEDVFAKICYLVKDAGDYVLCDPDDAQASSNKAITHYDLLKAKVPVPYTQIVRNWQPDTFSLSKEDIGKLGIPFIIKPAHGFGQKGIIKDSDGSLESIKSAREYNRGDDFLLQKKITPIILNNKKAWFRVYYFFGEIIPCWWDPDTGRYLHVSLREMYKHKLLPLARITSEIARLSNMEFFTTEIAITKRNNKNEYLAIDYVNDQPELCVRAHLNREGPVPEVVEHIAERVVDIAWRMKKESFKYVNRLIWLKEGKLEDETI
jgi:hypothetical protein